MENQGPQLLIAQILARGGEQRLPQEQIREYLRGRERPLAPRSDRLRLAIAIALVTVGKRIAGSEVQGPVVAAGPDGTVEIT